MSSSRLNPEINRRTFIASSAALAIDYKDLMNSTSDMEPGGKDWPEYDQVIVVDFLASPGYFNYPLNPPLNDSMIANAISSGITAVNLTVSGSNFTDTVQKLSLIHI